MVISPALQNLNKELFETSLFFWLKLETVKTDNSHYTSIYRLPVSAVCCCVSMYVEMYIDMICVLSMLLLDYETKDDFE